MTTTTLPPRGEWVRRLAAADRDALEAAVAHLRERYPARHRSVPRSGLGMLQLAEPNRGERFLLGEIPLASAEVGLTDGEGREHRGAACVMDEDQDLAEQLAICDAALAADLPGAEALHRLLGEGGCALAAEERIRASLLRRTNVAFDLLEEADDED